MNPCNSPITFFGSISSNQCVPNNQDKKECQNQRSEETNCLTAANTSDNNCVKTEFLNYLIYVNRKGLKVMHTNTYITFWKKNCKNVCNNGL